jgi:hypothetical protein
VVEDTYREDVPGAAEITQEEGTEADTDQEVVVDETSWAFIESSLIQC